MQFCRSRARRHVTESGYILIIFLMILAAMMIALTAAAPRLAQQIQRDREIEMVHRGEQYARAIKHYYKKFGRYPTRIEDLEKTNTIRFLRKRYKDPMTPGGNWRLVRYGEVQLGAGGGAVAGMQAQATATQSSSSSSSPSGMFNLNIGGNTGAGAGASALGPALGMVAAGGGTATGTTAPSATGATTGTTTGTTDSSNTSSDSTGTSSSAATSAAPQRGGLTSGSLFSSPATSAQPGAGGAIIGVASISKKRGIHEYAKKSHYNEWLFIYDPTQDRGQLLRGPYDPKAYFGQFNSQGIGKPVQSLTNNSSGSMGSTLGTPIAPSTFGSSGTTSSTSTSTH